jgi:hypothetical protein
VEVHSYRRKDGTLVRSHTRSKPNKSIEDNLGTLRR